VLIVASAERLAPLAAVPLPAFAHLFTEHAPYVGRTLRYLGVPDSDVEDACQEVFIVVHRRLAEIDRPEGVRSWIRRICVHVAQNARRSVRRRRDDSELPADLSADATQQDSAERAQLRSRLLRALDALSDDQRTVFVLYEIEQLTMNEVADAVGCPVQTAYSRLHAARDRVRAMMKEGS
jgi:RNA polymerase sigma-70 factor (ECF subfamily)